MVYIYAHYGAYFYLRAIYCSLLFIFIVRNYAHLPCIPTAECHTPGMMNLENMGNKEIRKELGRRLQRERLNQDITQATLAEQAGIARRTLVGAEKGEGTSLETLIAILRALGRLGQLDNFLPEPPLSPIELARLKGKVRQKASGKTRYPTPSDTPWQWKEDQ